MSGQCPRRHACSALLIALLAAATPHAQPLAAAMRFRYERAIVTAAGGPHRLALDVPLVAGAAPFTTGPGRSGGLLAENGLRDLRLFDASGVPVPHILMYAPRAEAEWADTVVLPIARTEKTSGFEANLGGAVIVDALSVSGIPAPFLKRMTLEGSGDREHWTILVADGTIFDLPGESLRQTTLTFPAGSYRYLRVTWDDRNSGRVAGPPMVQARLVTSATPPPTLTAPLVFERRPSEPGVSRFRLKLPAAHLPIMAIELDVRAGHVLRRAAVYESRLQNDKGEAAPVQLGSEMLKRVERDDLAAGSMRIPILAPAEAELELVVEDGSNPALALSGVTAVFAELPWIYFEAPAGTLVARFGNAVAAAPVYDLEAVRDSVKIAAVPDAVWGDVHPLARAEPADTVSPLDARGAAIDISGFAYSRTLPDGAAGLVVVPFDVPALAHAHAGDVRIVDGSNRQIPYLVERRNEPLLVPLPLQPAPSIPADLASRPGHSRSTYRVQFPLTNLWGGRLALETNARVFKRTVQLVAERPADRQHRDPWVEVLASAAWSHADQDSAVAPLVMELQPIDRPDLLLTVDEGDNSPLPITVVTLMMPSYRLRFYRPGGVRLSLVYGNLEVARPAYDLELLAKYVMGAEALEIAPGPEAAGPAPVSGAAAAGLVPKWAFWTLLAGAVGVLLALIARLVSQKT